MAIDEVGFKTAINPDEYTIWMNREKGIPIRKVRIFTPGVTQPIALKNSEISPTKSISRIIMLRTTETTVWPSMKVKTKRQAETLL